MRKLHLTNVNPGEFSKDKPIYERLKTFNNGLVEISPTLITVKTKDDKTFTSNLKKTYEDSTVEFFQGNYEDGTSFRLVLPGSMAVKYMKLQNKEDNICFGSMSGDGYAVTFNVVNISEPDIIDFEETRNNQFHLAIESKAESLVKTADALEEINPKMAAEHIVRFMNLLEQNELEALKFENIRVIDYGFILAIRLSLLNSRTAAEKINDIRLRYYSKDHLRYENGKHVSGPHGGAKRGIEIVPNFDLGQGYIVTVYNQDELNSVWGNNIQLLPKQMEVINRTEDEIRLQGFGEDSMGNSFSNYALSIHLLGNEIEYLKLYFLDRGVEIKYLK